MQVPLHFPGRGPRPRQAAAWGQGQAAGRRPVYSPYKAQEAGRRPPLRSSGGRPAGAPCPGFARAACGRPRLLHIFSQTQQPRLSPAPPSAGSCVGQGQAAGRRPVYSLYKAQEAGRRPPLRSSGGRPAGAPCPGEARAACGRISPLHRPAQRGETLPPRAQQQRLQLLAPQGSLQRGAGQRKLGAEAGRLFQGVILPEGHKIVVLPAQQRPQPGRTAA